MENYMISNSEDNFLKESVHQNYATIPHKIFINNAVAALLFLSVNTQASNWSMDKISSDYLPENTKIIVDGLKDRQVNEKLVDKHLILHVPRSFSSKRENVNYTHFKQSYEARLKSPENRMKLAPLFNFLSRGLEPVKIVRSLVDVSVKQRMIEFNLNMGGDVCVSVQKTLDTMEDDYVIFTVSLDGVLRSADCLPINVLQAKLLQLQNVIEESKRLS